MCLWAHKKPHLWAENILPKLTPGYLCSPVKPPKISSSWNVSQREVFIQRPPKDSEKSIIIFDKLGCLVEKAIWRVWWLFSCWNVFSGRGQSSIQFLHQTAQKNKDIQVISFYISRNFWGQSIYAVRSFSAINRENIQYQNNSEFQNQFWVLIWVFRVVTLDIDAFNHQVSLNWSNWWGQWH